jgi:UDP-N-acetylglucosamine 2-epimerase
LHEKGNGPKLIFAGTRPEIVKTAPVYKKLAQRGHSVVFCATFQHKDLSTQFLDFFGIVPELVLDVFDPGQSLCDLAGKLIVQAGAMIEKVRPACVLVQGDTMTAACAAFAAFLKGVPLFHIEAGLRTGDIDAPFPEEFNRRICTLAASFHFVPTQSAKNNLLAEGVGQQKIFLVGNTVVDSLRLAKAKIFGKPLLDLKIKQLFAQLKTRFKKIIIMTMHRRESFEGGLAALADGIAAFASAVGAESFAIIYPRHPNPATAEFADRLSQMLPENVFLCEPLGYADFVYLLSEANFVITDSGGVLEEACALEKPVICVREKTERQEALLNSNIFITGFDANFIEQAMHKLFRQHSLRGVAKLNNLFGDGQASEKIVEVLERFFPLPKVKVGVAPATEHLTLFNKITAPVVAVFGLGYIGLPTAIVLVRAGFNVVGIDTDAARIEKISRLEADFLEGSLKSFLQAALESKLLRLTAGLDVIADYFLICVPTPLKNDAADLSFVFSCVAPIAKFLKPESLVIIESTVPVGTTEQFAARLAKVAGKRLHQDFFVAYCPERVIPGQMEKEIVENDRVIGSEHPQAFLLASKLYKSFCSGDLSFTTCKIAELVKLLENSFRNVQVAFANEVFDIANLFGLEALQVIKIANKHPRVKILNPGPGVGGHCVAVDPVFIKNAAKDQCLILSSAINKNRRRPEKFAEQIIKLSSAKKVLKVLALGLAYKPDIGDLRESPALEIAQRLNESENIRLTVFEPHVSGDEKAGLPFNFIEFKTVLTEIQTVDVVAVLVAHSNFKELLLRADLKGKIVIDPTCLLQSLYLRQDETRINLRTIAQSLQ